jgi:hypothetical protein
MPPMETWKFVSYPLKYFHLDYEISNLGNVKRLGAWKNLRPAICSDGYPRIVIGGKCVYIHRLVAWEHVAGDRTQTVNHKNGIRVDCRAENLEWVSHAANIQHSYDLLGRVSPGETLRKPILATDATTGIATTFPSANDAARHLGHQNKAGNICKAIQTGRAAYGFYWSRPNAVEGSDLV